MTVVLALMNFIFAFCAPSTARASIDRIYIVQLTHLDIGFTAPPDRVAEECKARIDQVLGFLDTYPGFKWNIESVWQLEQWLNRTSDPVQIERLFDHVRSGRISVGGGYANMHSSMLGGEEMNRLFYPAQRLRKNSGIDISTMFMDDVPGWSWAIPQAAGRGGIAYFLTGPNTSFGGAADIPMSDRPFYFEGPDGSRILTWRGYGNYLEGSFDYGLHSWPSMMESTVLARLQDWESAGYPYDAILVLDGTGDNGMADRALETLDNVDWWNANHDQKMILSTPEEFFRHMEDTYHGLLPVYSGDSAGLWAGSGDCLTPVSQGWIRASADQVLTGEKLAAICFLNGSPYPGTMIDSIYTGLLTSDEHSGAGVGWPGMLTKDEVDRSNEIFFQTALRSFNGSKDLIRLTFSELSEGMGGDAPVILVFNPLSWERTGVVDVRLPGATYEGNFIIRDMATMREVPYEGGGGDTVEFKAQDVPPVGYRLYLIEDAPDPPSYPDSVTTSDNGRTIENRFYRVSIGGEGLSILDKENGRELVNSGSDFDFNGLIRATNSEDLSGLYHPFPSDWDSIYSSPGVVSGEMILESNSSPLTEVRITLYSGIKRVDLVNTLDKERMPFVPYEKHSEHYSITFPFAVDVSEGFRALIDNPNVLIQPDRDYLPGALVGNFVSQHAIDMREPCGFGVTLANRESFFNEIGGPGHRNQSFRPSEATVVNKVIQKADQGETSDLGVVTITSMDGGIKTSRFHYAITSSIIPPDSLASATPVKVLRFGGSFDTPLLAVFTKRGPRPTRIRIAPEASFFGLDHDNVILTDIKRSEFNGTSELVFRLQEVSGIRTTGVELRSTFSFSHAEINTNVEEPVPGGTLPVDPITFDIGPYETLTVRAR
jgi:hypothetical protein